ncbi:hypothetical protein THRCLA_02437 [Thraustotheca clavata]|uniref:Uncharacterized protein n=1 Tax=Thraustotheca clavata TaxID=74557 RepID=A0A1W0A566_9STRA|nr:hypothetical protein THRCLA_02437 [Thraustotheca clavata]
MPIKLLEHINLSIRDGGEANTVSARFYLDILGCARDPRMEWMVHANIGLGQFHLLPKQPCNQHINGHIALFYNDLNALRFRLLDLNYPFIENFGSVLNKGTVKEWNFEAATELYYHLVLHDPSGNQIICFESPLKYGEHCRDIGSHPGKRSLGDGLAYIKFLVRPGICQGISSFYQKFFGAKVICRKMNNEDYCTVYCDQFQRLIFEETNKPLLPYDGYHICIYIDDLEKAYHALEEKQLIWTNPVYEDKCNTWDETRKWNQFRILNIIDPLTNETLVQLEHEVRPLSHSRCPLKCEDNYVWSYYIAEWWNSWSNVPSIALAVYAMYKSRQVYIETHQPTSIRIAYLVPLIVFAGSFAFHCSLTYVGQLLDELPMMYGTLYFHYISLRHNPIMKWVVILFAIALTGMMAIYRDAPLPFQVAYGTLVAGLLLRSILFNHNHKDVRNTRLLNLGAILYVSAFVLWLFDQHFCSTVKPLHFHALWHLLSGAGTFVWIQFACAHEFSISKKGLHMQSIAMVLPYTTAIQRD